jgi:hypothetical protein
MQRYRMLGIEFAKNWAAGQRGSSEYGKEFADGRVDRMRHG